MLIKTPIVIGVETSFHSKHVMSIRFCYLIFDFFETFISITNATELRETQHEFQETNIFAVLAYGVVARLQHTVYK